MGITKAPGPRYVKDLPEGTNVWEFNAQKNTIFCKACIYDVDDSASKFALTIDEVRNVCGRSVAGVLVNNLDNNEKPALIEVIELDATNHRTIIQLVTKVLHLLCPDGDYARFKMFVTDGASYMLKAGSILKESYDILHVTCVAHALHRLSEFVRSKHQILDNFVSWMKKILLTSYKTTDDVI